MKIHELLSMNSVLFQTMEKHGIASSDIKYLPVYQEYILLKSKGGKSRCISREVAKKFNISERTVYYIAKKLSKEIAS